MPQNVFKIYDGRTNFWQWDTGQKLIVLDKSITEVHFSNRNMTHSIVSKVYKIGDTRVCNIPDAILQLPRNLVAHAYINDASARTTVKSVKFAVMPRPIPEGYLADGGNQERDIIRRLEILENAIGTIGVDAFMKFESIAEAEAWAQSEQKTGDVVAVRINDKWVACIVEDNYKVVEICDCDNETVGLNIMDGGDGDGYQESFQIWDGGNAFGI